jgi:DNA-binding response OmpR family regulator
LPNFCPIEGNPTLSKRILVVDDQKNALNLMSLMLKRGGFQVMEATNATEALDVLDRDRPDMIILDIMLEGMNGIELCRVIRAREDNKTLPILMLSALSDAETVLKSSDAGATDYLPKPVYHHNLVEKVRDLLNLQS